MSTSPAMTAAPHQTSTTRSTKEVPMSLNSAQTDRACGVLIASAAGDALGAGYEFTYPAADLVPVMKGGGLGGFAPGEWTDDTDQAVAIARVAARGIDLRSPEALDGIAAGFMEWFAGRPADIGIQTRSVLLAAVNTPTGAQMAEAARKVHHQKGRSSGNGSLMRTGPVALAYLDDPEGLVEAAMAISALTHYEDSAQEACALWCLMIRHAVLAGEFPRFADIEQWMPNADYWRGVLAEAEAQEPGTFTQNGWSVGALQAAWSAITHTPVPEGPEACGHLVDALGTAIRIGHDTDTVAAIAGALLGARWGMTAVPTQWRRMLHGWPGITVRELEAMAMMATRGGKTIKHGWPLTEWIDYAATQPIKPALVPHPHDSGVWLSDVTALDHLPADVDAVVSLCMTGTQQVPAGVEQVTVRLIDVPEADSNPNLDFVLLDTARTIAALRDEGKTVVLHCVAAHSRTPTVGIVYSMLRGVPLAMALPEVCGVLPDAHPNPGFRAALERIEGTGERGGSYA